MNGVGVCGCGGVCPAGYWWSRGRGEAADGLDLEVLRVVGPGDNAQTR